MSIVNDGALYAEIAAAASEELTPGALVRELRRRNRMSLKAVAEAIGNGVHFTTIGKIETGKMKFTADWGYAFAEVFQVPANFFFRAWTGSADVKSVPVYPYSARDLHDLSGAVASHYIGYVTDRVDLYAVIREGPPDIISDSPLCHLVISPEVGRFVTGSVYLLDVEGVEDAVVGICRNADERLHFLPWLENSREPVWPNVTSVKPLGRVLQVQRHVDRG